MEEQLVSFEIAELAKEKGFGLGKNDYIKLTTVYEKNGKLFNNGEFKVSANFSNSKTPYGQYSLDDIHTSIFEMDNSLDEFILAPIQSLLQKWLREIHNIDIMIKTWTGDKKGDKNYASDVYIFGTRTYKKCVRCPSYEEALEKGLLEGLKLIL